MSTIPGPSNPLDPDRSKHHASKAEKSNARIGMLLFVLYLAFYAGFVYLTAFSPETMKKPLIAGVTVAVVYGFSLIGSALLLALIYMMLCATEPAEGDEGSEI